MTDDLSTWLLEQVARLEGLATAARSSVNPSRHDGVMSEAGSQWSADGGMILGEDQQPLWDCEGAGSLCMGEDAAVHGATWDPAFVLAECEAKRRIIAVHRPEHAQGWTSCNVCHSGWSSELEPADWPCDTIKLLAVPFADRPGYREEWKS